MIGTTIGSYQIIAKLGAGGMGEVYRAKDTKLDREVAIKVLPESFAADADRVARFTREAKTLASLNHPNIAAIYGIEEQGETRALVMELVEGEDLSEVITRGAMPLPDALPIAKQIADALEAAHEQGIVHRDLKPQNIKVRTDGTVKVLDFGLAKAMDPDPSATSAMNSPTMTARATQMGMIIGTAAYMAPEQAKGKAVDKRADIWAFGVVLYEMLTGRRAFEGDETSDVLAAVLRQEIDWSVLPADTPQRIRQLLARCLERDVKVRLRDIGEARVMLADPGTAAIAPSHGDRRRLLVMTAIVAIAAAVVSALGVLYLRPGATASGLSVVRLPFDAPDNVVSEARDPVISPDGKRIAFTGRGADGRFGLWVRALDSTEATPLPDTDGAIEPFWSWDSQSVAFGAQGKLKRIDLGAARAVTLTDAARSNNGTWNRDGVIVFSPDYGAPLFKVAATGGPRVQVTNNGDRRESHRYPKFLPDGRHFLYWRGANEKVIVGSLDSLDGVELPVVGRAIYAPPGWLLFVRNGTVVAQAFDADRLRFSGEPVPIAADDSGSVLAALSVSETGILVIGRLPTFDYQLAWFDRTGAAAGTLGPIRSIAGSGLEFPRFSPDSARVVVQVNDRQAGRTNLWLGIVARGTFERLTTAPGVDQEPVWSADGRSVYASATRNQSVGIYRIPIDGGAEERVGDAVVGFPYDVTRDGRWLVYGQRGVNTRADVMAIPLVDGLAPKGAKPQVLINSEFDESAASVSPDGRWLAYNADVAGSDEVYVRRLTDGHVGASVRVTTGHGTMPRWSADGRTLFFVSAPNGYLSAQMMSVPITSRGDTLDFGAARPLFKVRMAPLAPTITFRDYDVAPDGRFLVGTVVGSVKGTVATVVLNWPSLVNRK